MGDRQDKKHFFSEKTDVILDLGVLYSKIGFISDNLPRKILKTPPALFKQLKSLNLEKRVFLADCLKDTDKLRFELEHFLHDIFYTELLINPSERNIFYVDNVMMPRVFTDTLGDILFSKFQVKKVFFVLGNSMPLYCTGLFSGVVVDCGFNETTVMPIYEGYPLVRALAATDAAGYQQDLLLKRKLFFEDNPNLTDKIFDIHRIENIKFKFIAVPSKEQYEQYTSSEENIRKMKHSLQEYDYQIHDEQTGQWAPIKVLLSAYFQISYYTRLTVGNFLFGSVEEDQPNIAYTLLQSLLQVDPSFLLKVAKNIVLAGGQCQMNGFGRRLRQEMLLLLEQRVEFKSLRRLGTELQFTNIVYPANTLHLVGTSMVGNIQAADQLFATSAQQYEYWKKVKDSFGDNYLYIQPDLNEQESDRSAYSNQSD